jgi:hypothetical protein
MQPVELAHLFCITVLVAVAAAFATHLWQSAALALAGSALQELNSLLLHDSAAGRHLACEHLLPNLLVLGGVALGIALFRRLFMRTASGKATTAHDESTAFCHHPDSRPQGERP